MTNPHIEIKARSVSTRDAIKFIEKGTIIGVVAAGKISAIAKKLLNDADIAWAENVSEELLESLLEGGELPC